MMVRGKILKKGGLLYHHEEKIESSMIPCASWNFNFNKKPTFDNDTQGHIGVFDPVGDQASV